MLPFGTGVFENTTLAVALELILYRFKNRKGVPPVDPAWQFGYQPYDLIFRSFLWIKIN